MKRALGAALVAIAALVLSACQSTSPSEPTGGAVLRVPADYKTPAAALAQAKAGDTVLLAPGTYEGPILIKTAGIRLRGQDRNTVVLDGKGLAPNGIVVSVSDVTIENLSVHDFTINGVLVTGMTDANGGIARGSDGYTRLDPAKFPPLTSFAVRSVTAMNNGLYGIYAFDSHNGVIEDTYTSGSADSGLYVGQCQECNIVVRNNVAEYNAVGYEQANASDSVIVAGNRFSDNRVGMTLLSDYQEAFVPQQKATIVGNLIVNNNQPATPKQADGGFGIGIGVGGGQGNQFLRNTISDNGNIGLALSSSADIPPLHNALTGNAFAGQKVDVGYYASARAPGTGNCLAGNTLTTVVPAAASEWTCPTGNPKGPGATYAIPAPPDGISFRKVIKGKPQPNRADSPWSKPAAPALDLAAYKAPSADLLVELTHR